MFHEQRSRSLINSITDRLPQKDIDNLDFGKEKSENAKKSVDERDPDDQCIEINISRNEAMEMLESLNISFSKGQTTAVFLRTLRNKLKSSHPIHDFLKKLETSKVKEIARKIKATYNTTRGKMCTKIANHFFTYHPNAPLMSFRKCLNSPEVEDQTEIDKKHPIFEFLRNVPDIEIKDYTKK